VIKELNKKVPLKFILESIITNYRKHNFTHLNIKFSTFIEKTKQDATTHQIKGAPTNMSFHGNNITTLENMALDNEIYSCNTYPEN